MKIKEFVELNKVGAKQGSVLDHITTEYIPYATKMAEAKKIVELSMYQEVDGHKKFWINTPMQYHIFIQRIIANYTDLEMENPVDDYDILNEKGLIVEIIKAIPSQEYNEFDTVLKMTVNDEIENVRSIAGYIDNKLDTFSLLLSSVLENEEIQKKLAELQENIKE